MWENPEFFQPDLRHRAAQSLVGDGIRVPARRRLIHCSRCVCCTGRHKQPIGQMITSSLMCHSVRESRVIYRSTMEFES
jgi:hypothetical protein